MQWKLQIFQVTPILKTKQVFSLCYKSTSTTCSGGYTSYTPAMYFSIPGFKYSLLNFSFAFFRTSRKNTKTLPKLHHYSTLPHLSFHITRSPLLINAEIKSLHTAATCRDLQFSVVAKLSSKLGWASVAIVRPILEFPREQGMNGSDSHVGDFAVTYVSREPKDSFWVQWVTNCVNNLTVNSIV